MPAPWLRYAAHLAFAVAAFALAACGSSEALAGYSAAEAAPAGAPAPAYSTAAGWLARSGAAGGSDVDVFYVHQAGAGVDDPFLASFDGGARIFAPRYREAASVAGEAVAYADVRRAFEYYLAHENGGRPIAIAGRGEGSALAGRLLEEEFEGRPLGRLLVAAYLSGAPSPRAYSPRADVHPCQSATDTECVDGRIGAIDLTWPAIAQSVRDRSNVLLAASGSRKPLVAGPIYVRAKAGAPFRYAIATLNPSRSYAAAGLPPGLALNAQNGEIAGTPRRRATYRAAVTARNAAGASSGALVIDVR